MESVSNHSLDLNIHFSINESDENNGSENETSAASVANVSSIMNNWREETRISIEQIATMVVPYSLIFFTAVVGNGLVVIVIIMNRRMRTKTNAFLLNLSISNFLLGVFCMPFTLIGLLMKEFIFGPLLCRLIPYLQ
ncbi:gastrin/cholecystokinin type B receptor-like protein, partial [Dinothrombium tinctorium]